MFGIGAANLKAEVGDLITISDANSEIRVFAPAPAPDYFKLKFKRSISYELSSILSAGYDRNTKDLVINGDFREAHIEKLNIYSWNSGGKSSFYTSLLGYDGNCICISPGGDLIANASPDGPAPFGYDGVHIGTGYADSITTQISFGNISGGGYPVALYGASENNVVAVYRELEVGDFTLIKYTGYTDTIADSFLLTESGFVRDIDTGVGGTTLYTMTNGLYLNIHDGLTQTVTATINLSDSQGHPNLNGIAFVKE